MLFGNDLLRTRLIFKSGKCLRVPVMRSSNHLTLVSVKVQRLDINSKRDVINAVP